MAAAGDLTWSMFGPEDVDYLGTVVGKIASFFWSECQRFKLIAHYLASGYAMPRSLMPARAIAGVERHDLRAYFGFDVGEQCFDLRALHIGKLILDHKPGRRG